MTLRNMLLAILFCVAPLAAVAKDGKVLVELNKLELEDGICQSYMLLQNGTNASFEGFTLDLVLFDTDGIIVRRLAAEMAPLRAGKTSVKVFGLNGLACDAIGRILVNDVLDCQADGTPRNDCPDLIETASRGSVELFN